MKNVKCRVVLFVVNNLIVIKVQRFMKMCIVKRKNHQNTKRRKDTAIMKNQMTKVMIIMNMMIFNQIKNHQIVIVVEEKDIILQIVTLRNTLKVIIYLEKCTK